MIPSFDIDNLPPEQAEAALARLEAIKTQRAVENALAHYVPYPRQEQFHNAGATHRERLLIAANQSGKSLAGGMECAMHATGRYPDWWRGRRFDKPTIGWGAGTTNETTRDTVQRILVGRPGQPGTGAIPKDAILDLVPARGTPDLLDSIKVGHVSGGVSVIGLKSYQRGRDRMGASVCSGRIGLGQRYRHRLRHEMLSRPRGNRRHSCGRTQTVGCAAAVGVATGWPTRDVGRRRQAACGSISSAGP
jgi:phage terminase large subunit-like protein